MLRGIPIPPSVIGDDFDSAAEELDEFGCHGCCRILARLPGARARFLSRILVRETRHTYVSAQPMRILLALFAFAAPLSAATFYVAPTGLDSADGSEFSPWKTIQKAANTLAPGDTALVRGGVYSEAVTVNVSGTAAAKITIAAYPGEIPILDGSALTIPANSETGLFLLVGRSHVIVRGFELRNFKSTDPSRSPAGVFLSGACSFVEIRDCHIHNIWKTGGSVKNPGSAFGIAVYGSSITPATGIVIDGNHIHECKTGWSETLVLNGNVTDFQVTRNTIHDCNNIGIDFIAYEGTCPDAAQDRARDGVCRDNQVWNISSEGNPAYGTGDFAAGGIYVDGGTRIVIERNVSHHNDIGVELAAERPGKLTDQIKLRGNFIHSNRQTGLFLGGYESSGTGGTSGCVVTGNTFRGNDTLGWDNGEIQLRFRTSGCSFRNNIFSAGASGWLVTVPVSAVNNVNNTFDFNLFHSATDPHWKWNNSAKATFAAWKSASGQDAHSLFADPAFASANPAPDVHLQLTSPAVNAGDPAFTPAVGETDIDGGPRVTGSAVDIGADELAPFQSWRVGKFSPAQLADAAISGPAADADADGLPNLLEYAFAGNPLHSSRAPLPTGTGSAMTFLRAESTADLDYRIQVSTDLTNWNNGPLYSADGEITANEFGSEESRVTAAGGELITVGSAARFMRVAVTLK